ncbi:MAG: OmpA family protein [Rhodobacteraceae bacterium]|nr:OmpA family protein [Paracoccaceae bacterium]
MTHRLAAVLAASLAFLLCPAASAQPVTLQSDDGGLRLQGEILDYDGEYYRIDTKYGILTVSAAAMRCLGESCPDTEGFIPEFRISGAATTGDTLMPGIVEAFVRDRGYRAVRVVQDDTHFRYELFRGASETVFARIRFRVSSTEEGFADLVANQAEIAMAIRPVRFNEIERGIEAGIGDLGAAGRSMDIALDALVPIASRKNAVTAMGVDRLAAAFSGRARDWADLGGAQGPVRLYLKNDPSGLTGRFRTQVLGPQDMALSSDVQRFGSNADLAGAVAANPAALAISALSEIGNARTLALSGSCAREVAATTNTLLTGDYPFVIHHRLFMPDYVLPAIAREFLEFVRAPAGRRAVEALGYVPPDRVRLRLRPASRPGTESDAPKTPEFLDGAERLAFTFRFDVGTADLDANAQDALRRLAAWLEANTERRRRLFIVGFTDGVGAAGVNERLSQRRSALVRASLEDLVSPEAWQIARPRAIGLGERAPIACDDMGWGRQVNRRVEVWTR